MRIGVLGAGRMGSALGRRWSSSGHAVTYSFGRNAAKLAVEVSAGSQPGRLATPAEAVADSDVILLAVPWSALDLLLEQAGALAGKVVLSCVLPMGREDQGLGIGRDDSGAEALARRQPGIRLVPIFNTIPSELIVLLPGVPKPERPQVICCGDDVEAKGIAMTLSRDIGFEPLDAGGLLLARYIEPFGLLVGQIAYEQATYGAAVGYRFFAAGGPTLAQ